MPQINNGRVRLVNGSTTVQALYNVYLSITPNELVVGSEVQWGATGSHDDGEGVIVEVDGSSYWIYRSSNSDEPPAVGDTLKLQTGGSATPTIESMGAASPPNWSTNLTGVVGTPMFTIRDNTSPALAVASSTLDELVLATPWPGSTVANIDYGISTDFTPNLAFPLIAYGDIDSPALLSLALTEIDRNLAFSGALISSHGVAEMQVNSNSYTTLTTLTNVQYDDGNWVETENDSFFTVPLGVTRVRLIAGLSWEPTDTAQGRRSARIYKNTGSGGGDVGFVGMVRPDGWADEDDTVPNQASGAFTAVIAVDEGDIFVLKAYSEDGLDVLDSRETFFAIEAVSFS